MKVLAIDPGNIESGIVMLDDYRPIWSAKILNEKVGEIFGHEYEGEKYKVVIEQIASYGMAVGREVFDTAMWSGRFLEMFLRRECEVEFVPRTSVKMNLCHTARAKDANVTQALVDRFTPGQKNKGKGTKNNPGWFYGFKADIWQAYALGVTYVDMRKAS